MNEAPPIEFQWQGDGFRPTKQFWAKKCDEHFVVGEIYKLVEHHDRSQRSHNHYFACVHNAWQNLPEEYEGRFPTQEHLRHWVLVKTGYCTKSEIVTALASEATKLAAFARQVDTYSVITVQDCVVTIYRAKSQSMRSMGKDEFQASNGS
jgi:hypothetical protein